VQLLAYAGIATVSRLTDLTFENSVMTTRTGGRAGGCAVIVEEQALVGGCR
jgi:hypothetical protein